MYLHKWRETAVHLLLLALASILSVVLTFSLWEQGWLVYLDAGMIEGNAFHSMDFGKGGLAALEQAASDAELSLSEAATVWMIHSGYHLPSSGRIRRRGREWLLWREQMQRFSAADYEKILRAYRMVLEGAACFPVGMREGLTETFYEDSWLEARDYGGERQHEGCDIMSGSTPTSRFPSGEYPRGTYPVVSCTDGVIERMGWLPLGGWRIGIRTDGGGYFYYAHLYDYAPGLSEGMRIGRGALLGWMGDSGYGEEGTVGMFSVHLHFGIYISTKNREELAVNPYRILQYLEKKQKIRFQ